MLRYYVVRTSVCLSVCLSYSLNFIFPSYAEKQQNPNRQAINLVDKQFFLNANRCQNASYFYGQVTLKNATIDYVTAAACGGEKCRLAVAGTGLWEAGSLGLRDVIITWRKSPDVT